MTDKCTSMLGHKYEGRYDEEPNAIKLTSIEGCSVDGLRKLMIRKVYVRDVCTRCGRTIERTP